MISYLILAPEWCRLGLMHMCRTVQHGLWNVKKNGGKKDVAHKPAAESYMLTPCVYVTCESDKKTQRERGERIGSGTSFLHLLFKTLFC